MGLKIKFRKGANLSGAETVVFVVLTVAFSAIFFVGFAWFFSALLAWAWAATMVPVFALPAITKWQAFAFLVILGFVGNIFRSKR